MDNFTNVVESAEKSIAVKLNLNTQKQIEENRKKLLFHRYNGDFIQSSVNDKGNFRELLKFCMDSSDNI